MAESIFQPGDFVYHTDEQGWFLLYKVLGNEYPYLVRCYWPSPEEPTVENLQRFDVRTSCEESDLPPVAKVLTNEAVSSEDEQAKNNFLRIKAGIESRKSQWKSLLSEAEEWMRQQRYEEVVRCCTECASFFKYEARVFQLRGRAYLQLERYSEAIADLEHALSIQPNHTETLFDCAQALTKNGKGPAARAIASVIPTAELNEAQQELLQELLSA